VNVDDLDTPALVVDLDVVEANITAMADLARSAGVRLRPHTKTHKMPDLARAQVAAGAAGITCAKVGEAEVMVAAGLDDVLIAFPLVGPAKLARLAALRDRARILVALDSFEVAEGLARVGAASGDPLEVFVEVDTGHHRAGLAPGEATAQLAARVAELRGVRVVGLLTFAGHAYAARSRAERAAVVAREGEDLAATVVACAARGVAIHELSVGSTPGVGFEARVAGVTEVRPGTYIFNDTTMIDLGVATEATCAATVRATVVARPAPDRFVVDAGTKSLTSDGVGRPGWIRVAGRDDLSISFLTEEHGVGAIDRALGGHLAIGDTLSLIPSHVCPVVNLFDVAYGVREGVVVDELAVAGRGRSR